MARLFASFEEANNLTELEHVDHIEVKNGPCSEEDCEKYTEIKEAVEEALDAQGEVQEQIQTSEEILESSPNSVSESDVQAAQECLISTLSRLGLSRQDLVMYRISNESYMPNEDRLRESVKKLKLAQETIRRSLKSAILESYRLSDRQFGISQEYLAIDWPKLLLGGLNTIWRAITDKSKTRINHPGVLVGLMSSRITTVLDIFSYLNYVSIAKAAIDKLQEKETRLISKKASCNSYRSLFNDYKKVNISQIDVYKQEFEMFKQVVAGLKSTIVTPCGERYMSTSEINDIKLFRPDKAAKEMNQAIAYFKSMDPEFAKFAEGVAA